MVNAQELAACHHLQVMNIVNFRAERVRFLQRIWKITTTRFAEAFAKTKASYRSVAWKKFLITCLLPVYFTIPTDIPDFSMIPIFSYAAAFPFLFDMTRGAFLEILRQRTTSHMEIVVPPANSDCITRVSIFSLDSGCQDGLIEQLWQWCFPLGCDE